MLSVPFDSALTTGVSSTGSDNSGKPDCGPDFVLDTFDQWTNSTDVEVAPTVCSCFRH